MPTYEMLFLLGHIMLTCYMVDVISSVYKFVQAMSPSLFRVLYHLRIRHLCVTLSIKNDLIKLS